MLADTRCRKGQRPGERRFYGKSNALLAGGGKPQRRRRKQRRGRKTKRKKGACLDKIIKHYPFKERDGFRYCYGKGVVYQANMEKIIPYDDQYYESYAKLEDSKIAMDLNRERTQLVDRNVGEDGLILDIGIGSGAFIKHRNNGRGRVTFGTDINDKAIGWLKAQRLYVYRRNWDMFKGYCFWDSLEHMPDASEYFDRINPGKYVFISMPIYGEDLDRVPQSKHFKPGEHLYYFSDKGLKDWMAYHGFDFLEKSTHEKLAGRNRIYQYVFRRERD